MPGDEGTRDPLGERVLSWIASTVFFSLKEIHDAFDGVRSCAVWLARGSCRRSRSHWLGARSGSSSEYVSVLQKAKATISQQHHRVGEATRQEHWWKSGVGPATHEDLVHLPGMSLKRLVWQAQFAMFAVNRHINEARDAIALSQATARYLGLSLRRADGLESGSVSWERLPRLESPARAS